MRSFTCRAFQGFELVLTLLLPATSATSLLRRDSWGGALSLGPSTSTIIHAVTTLIPGAAPSTQTGELFLWPGMSNGTGDLIQTTLESWPSNAWCGAITGQWCVSASLFGSFGQLSGTAGVVGVNDQVKIEYALQSDGTTWLQTVTNAVTGALLSTYSHSSGPYMRGYGTGTECDDGCVGTIAPQTYKDTIITLAGADPNFGSTLGVSGGTTYTGLSSSNGGQVWTISSINIPAMLLASGSTGASSSSKTSTTLKTSTTSKISTTSTESATGAEGSTAGTVPKYGQCGGAGYTGSTTCATGSTCTYSNAYYSQCI